MHHSEQIDCPVGNKVVSLIANSDVVSVPNLSLSQAEVNFWRWALRCLSNYVSIHESLNGEAGIGVSKFKVSKDSTSSGGEVECSNTWVYWGIDCSNWSIKIGEAGSINHKWVISGERIKIRSLRKGFLWLSKVTIVVHLMSNISENGWRTLSPEKGSNVSRSNLQGDFKARSESGGPAWIRIGKFISSIRYWIWAIIYWNGWIVWFCEASKQVDSIFSCSISWFSRFFARSFMS